MSKQELEKEIQHILGHCMCRDDEVCWWSTTYDRLKSEEWDSDVVDNRMCDEEDKAIMQLIKDHERALLDRVRGELPDYEEYSDYEHGSHAEGWNDNLNEIKSALARLEKEL